MSGCRGRPEVIGASSNRRSRPKSEFDKNRNAASFGIVSPLDSRQGDRDLRNVGCSGGVDRDRLPIGLGRHGQIRCESDAIDFTANSRAGNRPGDVADRIARDLIPFAGETGSRRGYIASDVELVAVARTEQADLTFEQFKSLGRRSQPRRCSRALGVKERKVCQGQEDAVIVRLFQKFPPPTLRTAEVHFWQIVLQKSFC